ncbi:MAG TPA: antibiotic biosynthesis monooxygenase [Gammaproteobacteria bacterium]|nr:antibiotic biosynthesis monooxygenase [Gammaproteobacteria bacterium]
MTAFNVVRFRVKPGYEQRFLDTHRQMPRDFKGYIRGDLIKTGERSFCIVGEWRDMDSLVAARPQMIAVLDVLRDMLEDLGGGLGVTDPVSGESVLALGAPETKKATSRSGTKKKRKKTPKEKTKTKSKSRKKPKKK